MIKIVVVNQYSCPKIFCDWCQEEIESAAEGNYEWIAGIKTSAGWEYPDTSEIYFTHKRCCHPFESANEHIMFGADMLECLPVYLGENLKLNWVKARKTALAMGGFYEELVERPPLGDWLSLRQQVFQRDKFRCQYCGRSGGKLECDHVVPIARGGSNALSNLVTACKDCNRDKKARPLEEWLTNRKTQG